MRLKVMLPTTVLLVILFFTIGYALTLNVSQTVDSVINMQMDENINIVDRELKTTNSLKASKLQKDAKVLRVANTGGVLVIDNNNNVIADSLSNFSGANVGSQPWLKTLRATPSGSLTFNLASTEVYAKVATSGYYLICAFVPTAELNSYHTASVILTVLLGSFGILLFLNILYFAITRTVIKPLEVLFDRLEGYKQGEVISTHKLKRSSAIYMITVAINDILRHYTKAGSKEPEDAAAEDAALPTQVEAEAAPAQLALAQAASEPAPEVEAALAERPVASAQAASEPAPEVEAAPAQATPEAKPAPEEPALAQTASLEPTLTKPTTSTGFAYIDIFKRLATTRHNVLAAKKLGFKVSVDREIPERLVASSALIEKLMLGLIHYLAVDAKPGSTLELLTKLVEGRTDSCTVLVQVVDKSTQLKTPRQQRLVQCLTPKKAVVGKTDPALVMFSNLAEQLQGHVWARYSKNTGLVVSFTFVAGIAVKSEI